MAEGTPKSGIFRKGLGAKIKKTCSDFWLCITEVDAESGPLDTRIRKDFWGESDFGYFKWKWSHKALFFFPCKDGKAAKIHAFLYVVLIILLLVADYYLKFHPGILIVIGFFISLAPRWYWWGICHRFEKWIFSEFIKHIEIPTETNPPENPDKTVEVKLTEFQKQKNADLEREIKYYRSHFNVHKEYALALWLAALAFLGTYLYSDVVTARTGIVRVNEYVELCRYSEKDIQRYRGPELRTEEKKFHTNKDEQESIQYYMDLTGRLTKEAVEINSIIEVKVDNSSEEPKYKVKARDSEKGWVKSKTLKECNFNPFP